jgi:proteasome-associated ATPase
MPHIDDLRELLQEAQAEIGRLNDVIQELTEDNPPRHGVVVHAGKSQVDISTGAGVLSLDRKDIHKNLKAGMAVRISNTAILGEPEQRLYGPLMTVRRVVDKANAEVGEGPQSRIVKIAPDVKVEEGHEVILDPDGRIIVRSLGAPKAIGLDTDSSVAAVKWSDIGGLEQAKAEIREAVEQPALYPQIYARYGKRPPAGILLYGPPGCGKTLLARALTAAVSGVGGKMLAIKGPEVLDPYVGVAEATIRNLFRRGKEMAQKTGRPTVIFIDEAEAILAKRGSMRSSDVDKTIVPSFLAEMGGIEDMQCMVVLATNLHDALDPAVIRDGRIDRRIHVPRPDLKAATEILKINISKSPVAAGETAASLAKAAAQEVFCTEHTYGEFHDHQANIHLTLKFSDTINGAMLAGIVDRAKGAAIKREIESRPRNNGLTIDDLKVAIKATYQQNRNFSHDTEIQELYDQKVAAIAA